jgi:hypothetical protein
MTKFKLPTIMETAQVLESATIHGDLHTLGVSWHRVNDWMYKRKHLSSEKGLRLLQLSVWLAERF